MTLHANHNFFLKGVKSAQKELCNCIYKQLKLSKIDLTA